MNRCCSFLPRGRALAATTALAGAAVLSGCATPCGCAPPCGAAGPAADAAKSTVASSGTSLARPLSPVHLIDADGGYVGQYLATQPGAPAAAMLRLPDGEVATVFVDGPQGQLRTRRGLVLSARADCGPPYYLEQQEAWQAPYPGALLAELRTVQGRRLAFASRGHFTEVPPRTTLYVVGACEPTFGYRRAVAPVDRVVELGDRLKEPFALR